VKHPAIMLDLSRVNLIRESTVDQLKDVTYVENLIIKLGFNREGLIEQPQLVKDNGGGLLIWQYPNQFSKYLMLLNSLNARSYIEIGCRWGGTFVLTTEYLKKFNAVTKSVSVDIMDSPVRAYCDLDPTVTSFIHTDSTAPEFRKFVTENAFDVVFIDGDHSYEGVQTDYETCKNIGSVFVFHDIVSDACPGVIRFWNEMKSLPGFEFHEFVEQYEDVQGSFLGIGVAIKRNDA
jgi:cephalosporin hydroxylase